MNDIDDLLDKLATIKIEHPNIVVILMHEVMRSIYPSDPYIPFNNNESHLERLTNSVNNAKIVADAFAKIGSYKKSIEPSELFEDIKDTTGSVYGTAWSNNDNDIIVKNAKAILDSRFKKNNISNDLIKGKKVLDLGCGSGRYSCALAMFEPNQIVAVDWGNEGLEKGKKLAKHHGLNITFKKENILDLSFEDETFDFIFCNGVTHHTEDMKKATSELYRVLRPSGSAWYYVYGAGGKFWEVITKFNKFMKNGSISKEFSSHTLKEIGMPEQRHVFIDHWYVPILSTTSKDDFEKMLLECGFNNYERLTNGQTTDPDFLSIFGDENDKMMFGDGELRYIVKK